MRELLEHDHPLIPPPKQPAGPPWRIGWFGMICRKSLDARSLLALEANDTVEIIMHSQLRRCHMFNMTVLMTTLAISAEFMEMPT